VERLVESRKSKAERWQDIITYDDVCEIARHQIEELKSQPGEIVFFDTELIVTKVWFEYAFGHMPEWLDEALVRYPMDIYLLTYPDLPWIPDPARSNGSDTIRLELFERYEAEVQALGIPYFIIRHED
jgi:nicotinamide riboside kinase